MKRNSIIVVLSSLIGGLIAFSACGDQDFVVSVDRPLRTVYLSPADGTEGVSLETRIVAVFSEAVKENTVTSGKNFYVVNEKSGQKIEGDISYDAKKLAAVFTPKEPLEYSTAYKIYLTSGIQKRDTEKSFGGELAIEVEAVFRTVNPKDLALVYTNPGAGAWEAPIDAPIELYFSEPVDTDTVIVGESLKVVDFTFEGEETELSGSISWNEEETKATFTPDEAYGYSRQILIILTEAVASKRATPSGGTLASEISVPFATVDPPPLYITFAEPSGASSGYARETSPGSGEASSFWLHFSEGVAQKAVDINGDGVLDNSDASGAIVVEDVSEDLSSPKIIPMNLRWLTSDGVAAKDAPADYRLIGEDSVLEMTPLNTLDYSRLIRITVKGDVYPPLHSLEGVLVSDRATYRGGQMPQTIEFFTRIEDPPPLLVVDKTPSSPAEGETKHISRETYPNSGTPSSLRLVFTEGVKREDIDINGDGLFDESDKGGAIMIRDITGNPATPTFISGSLKWLDPEGEDAEDAPPHSDLVGKDSILVFTPQEILDYSTLVQVTIKGDDETAYPLEGVVMSDRATFRGGQLPSSITYQYRIEDPPPLMIESVVTTSGRLPALRNNNGAPDGLVITFSEGVARGEDNYLLESGLMIVEDVTGLNDPLNDVAIAKIDGTLSWNNSDAPKGTDKIGEDYIATFTPSTFLGYGTAIRLTIKGNPDPVEESVKSDRATHRGGNLAATKIYLIKVETIPDLYVTGVIPTPNADNAPINAPIIIKFSEGIDCSTINTEFESGTFIVNFGAEDPVTPNERVVGAFSPACVDGATALTFVPTNKIKYSRNVSVALSEAIASVRARDINPAFDSLQGHLRNGFAFAYATEDPPPLAVISVESGSGKIPAPRLHNGAPDTVIITFSEGVNRSSGDLLGSLIKFIDVTGGQDNGEVEGELMWNAEDAPDPETLIGSDAVAVFKPEAPLGYGTILRLVIEGAPAPELTKVRSDRATSRGGQLANAYTYDISIEKIPDLHIVSTTPAVGADQVPINTDVNIKFSEGISCDNIESEITINKPGAFQSCTNGTTTLNYIFNPPVKYSVDIQMTMSDKVMSLRAKDVNPKADPLMGRLRGGYTLKYHTEDPPSLRIVSVIGSEGNLVLKRDVDGDEATQDPEGIVITFSEGVLRDLNGDNTPDNLLGSRIFVRDITGGTDNGVIDGTLTWNASDAPDSTTLIGSDRVATFYPSTPWQWGTEARVTILGSTASDRATDISGQLDIAYTAELLVERLPELYIVKTSPGHGATGIEKTRDTISVTFFEAPDCAFVNTTEMKVSYASGGVVDGISADPLQPGVVVAGAWDCVDGNKTVVFTAAQEFGYGRSIALNVSTAVADRRAAGDAVNPKDPTQGHISPAQEYRFSTERLTKIIVTSTNFAGSTSFDRLANLKLAFDKDVACDTVTATNFFINRGSISDINNKLNAAITCVAPSTLTIELDPVDTVCDPGNTALCYDQEYTVTLKGGHTGICSPEKNPADLSDDGCIESPDIQYRFSTQPRPQLAVNITPAHNETGVGLSVKPTCIFTNSILTSTVENEPGANPSYPDPDGVIPNICLIKGRNKTDCSDPDVVPLNGLQPYIYEAGNTIVKINTAADLDPDTDYTVVVSRDIEDIEGNRLSGFNTNSFKTVPGGLLIDVTAVNRTDINNLYIRARFTKEIEVSTIHGGTFYLTFKDEFGATRRVPAVVSPENWGGGTCDPSSTGNADCNSAHLVPDLMALFACDPLTYERGGEDGSVIEGSQAFTSASYNFVAADIGKYITLIGAENAANNGSYIIGGISGNAALLNNANFVSETEIRWILGEAPASLPYNTNYEAHLSSHIVSSDGLDHVPISGGEDEYIYAFSTDPDPAIRSVVYSNAVIAETRLANATEAPVNSEFSVYFEKPVDPASVNANTLLLEDARGEDGETTAGTNLFTVSIRGTFVVGRDEGKIIEISGSAAGDDGIRKIDSINSDTQATLSGAAFVGDTNLNWSRYLDGSTQAAIEVSADGLMAKYRPLNNLYHHSDYNGFYASVPLGGNTITVSSRKELFRFDANRDLGKRIEILNSALGNNGSRTITAIDLANNRATVDGAPFAAAEIGLRWKISDNLDYHRLIIRGRTLGDSVNVIKDASGQPLHGEIALKFFTSPETFSLTTPVEEDAFFITIYQLQRINTLFSREIRFASLTDDAYYLEEDGRKTTSIIGYSYENRRAAEIVPIPYFAKDSMPVLFVRGVTDYLGNPVRDVTHEFPKVSTSPSSAAMTLDIAPNILPASGSSIKGNQRIEVYYNDAGSTGTWRRMILPSTYNKNSLDLTQRNIKTGVNASVTAGSEAFFASLAGTFSPSDVGKIISVSGSTAGNNGRRTIVSFVSDTEVSLDKPFTDDASNISWEMIKLIDFEVEFVPGGYYGDWAEIRLKENLTGGSQIRLVVDTTKIGNLYTLPYTAVNTYNYTVEEIAPTINAATIVGETEAGVLALDGRDDVLADTYIRFTANEELDPATINGTTATLTDTAANAYKGTFEVSGNIVTFKPNVYLKSSGNPYLFRITTGAKDMAGNPLGSDVTATFDVETTAPSVSSTNPDDADNAVGVSAPIYVEFSESVNAASVLGSTRNRAGTLTLAYTPPVACDYGFADAYIEDEIYGCISLSSDGKMIRFDPVAPRKLIDEYAFAAVVKSSITDRAGNSMAGDYNFSFDTIGGDAGAPQALCSNMPTLVGEKTIDIHFNKALSAATVDAATVIVFEAETGFEVNGVVSLEGGGEVVRFTSADAFDAGKRYGVILTIGIEDAANLQTILEEYNFFFDGAG